MISRHLFCLACWLLSLACSAGQNDNYPFSIDSEKTPDGHRLVAHNAGPAPVSVKVSIINGQYIATDRRFPLYVVVPPGGGTLYLGNIRAAMSGVGYSFQTQYTWTLGDFNANQSPDAVYRLPFRDGTTFRIGQAPGGPITTHHSPDSQYAVDIPMPKGTPVLAAREGTVIYTEANQTYGAQIPDMLSKANEVRIQHVDGTIGIYAHLAHGGVYVYPGQTSHLGPTNRPGGLYRLFLGASFALRCPDSSQKWRKTGNDIAALQLLRRESACCLCSSVRNAGKSGLPFTRHHSW